MVLKEARALIQRQRVWLAHMPLADQHGIALNVLVSTEPEAAKFQIRNGVSVDIGQHIGSDRQA